MEFRNERSQRSHDSHDVLGAEHVSQVREVRQADVIGVVGVIARGKPRAGRLAVALGTLAVLGILASACAEGTTGTSSGSSGKATTSNATDPEDDGEDSKLPSNDTGTKKDASTPSENDDDGGGDGDPETDSGVDAGKDSGGGTCVTAPPSNACGVSPQCGCSANQTCDVTNLTTGAVGCVNAGNVTQGKACTSTTQCAVGLTCQRGVCRPFCDANGTCTGAGTSLCYSPEDANGVATPNLDICNVTCDPRNPSAACGTNTCLWYAGDADSDCNKPGTGTLYDYCSTIAGCAAGLVCEYDPYYELDYVCFNWCRIGADDCDTYELCDDVYGTDAPVVNGVKLGVCR